jgi:hypothetical protein
VYLILRIPYINYIQVLRYYLDTCQESRYLSGQSLLRLSICLAYPLDTDLGTQCPTLRVEKVSVVNEIFILKVVEDRLLQQANLERR